MCAGPKYEYRWADGVKVKKPIECSAPVYVFHLMEWVESVLDDQTVRGRTVTFVFFFLYGRGIGFPAATATALPAWLSRRRSHNI